MLQAKLHIQYDHECILTRIAEELGGCVDIEVEEMHDNEVTLTLDASDADDIDRCHRMLRDGERIRSVERLDGESFLISKPSCGAYAAIYRNDGILWRRNHVSNTQRVYNVLVFHRDSLKDIISDFRDHGTVTLGQLKEVDRSTSVGSISEATGIEELTSRQREILQHAREQGYFDWPRESNCEEMAETLGITRATFLEHLRKAEAKLVSGALDERTSTSVAD